MRRFASACLGLVAWIAGALVAGPASAQAPAYFTGNGCVGCHGNPAQIGAPIDNRGNTIIAVGTATWLASDALFRTRLLAPGVPQMTTLANEPTSTNRDIVRNYLIDLRDGRISTTTRTFASTNIGGTRTLSVVLTSDRHLDASFSVSKSGTHPGDFTVSGCGLNVAGANGSVPNAVAGAAGSCSLSIDYSPAPGSDTSRSADLTINYSSNEGGNPADRVVALSGTVPPAALAFTPGTTQTTARVDLGASSDSNVGTITNSGQATLSIASITRISAAPVGATYVQITTPAGACSTTPVLGAGQSCDVWIRYTPSLSGTTSATFRITPNVGAAQDFTLQGTGTRPLIDPTSPPNLALSFGNTQQGVPKLLSQVISNTGDAPLTFTVSPTAAGARSGAHPGDFGVGLVCASGPPIPAGGSCTLNVTFTPAALGPREALLTISSDATNGPLLISLSGTGVALPEPVVTYPATDFPDTVIGETAAQTRTVTIRNDRIRDITYGVAGTTDFAIGAESCGAGRTVLGGGGTCTVAIQFQPTLGSGEGLRQAAIVFTFAGTGGDAAPSNVSGNVAGRALLPLAQSSSTLNAAAVVGSPATASMLLTNRGSTPLTLSSLVFGGASAAEFTLDATNGCTAGLALAASASCTLVVRFAPTLAGSRSASLTLTHSKPGSPQTVTLAGTATPAPQGRIELGALALTFPSTQLGSTSAQSVIVRNAGDLALTFASFSVGGAAAAEFERSGDCSVAAPLAIGAQCTLTMTFRPAATLGVRTASLTIASDASNGAATLSLSGTAIPVPVPQVTLTPASLDFGVQTIGGLYPARRIRLANSGTADLAVASVAVEGTGFSNASAAACPAVLAPGAGCDIDIVLATTSAIAYNGSLRVTSNAAGSPHTAPLTGSGSAAAVAVLTWSPLVTNLDFGSVSAGSVSAVQSVNLLNQGPGGVNLTVLNAIGPDASAFSVVGGTCAFGTPLFQGDTCRIDVRFAPGSAGAKTALVQVASTGSFPPALTLSGVGLGGPSPSLAVSASSLAFGTTRVGAQSLPEELRLTSNGSSVVRVTALEVTGSYAIQSTTCPALPFTLAAGTDCTVLLSFRPAGAGAAVGILRVTSESNPAIREIALSGSGEEAAEVSGGGCTIGFGRSLLDPTLWLLGLLSLAVLGGRRRIRPSRGGTGREGGK